METKDELILNIKEWVKIDSEMKHCKKNCAKEERKKKN